MFLPLFCRCLFFCQQVIREVLDRFLINFQKKLIKKSVQNFLKYLLTEFLSEWLDIWLATNDWILMLIRIQEFLKLNFYPLRDGAVVWILRYYRPWRWFNCGLWVQVLLVIEMPSGGATFWKVSWTIPATLSDRMVFRTKCRTITVLENEPKFRCNWKSVHSVRTQTRWDWDNMHVCLSVCLSVYLSVCLLTGLLKTYWSNIYEISWNSWT